MTLMSHEIAPTNDAFFPFIPDTARDGVDNVAAIDPLADDDVDDDIVVITRRGLCRVALVAVETADRFRREGLGYDPMAWLLAPRRLFDGATALNACVERDACMRGVLVHGLGLGLDIDARTVDALTDPSDDDADDAGPGSEEYGDDWGAGRERAANRETASRVELDERLFTATVVANDGTDVVHAFHASLAGDEASIVRRLYARMGPACADARIVEGFDPSDPMVKALVAPAVADTLVQVAADPSSPLASGFDLNVEQRFRD